MEERNIFPTRNAQFENFPGCAQCAIDDVASPRFFQNVRSAQQMTWQVRNSASELALIILEMWSVDHKDILWIEGALPLEEWAGRSPYSCTVKAPLSGEVFPSFHHQLLRGVILGLLCLQQMAQFPCTRWRRSLLSPAWSGITPLACTDERIWWRLNFTLGISRIKPFWATTATERPHSLDSGSSVVNKVLQTEQSKHRRAVSVAKSRCRRSASVAEQVFKSSNGIEEWISTSSGRKELSHHWRVSNDSTIDGKRSIISWAFSQEWSCSGAFFQWTRYRAPWRVTRFSWIASGSCNSAYYTYSDGSSLKSGAACNTAEDL